MQLQLSMIAEIVESHHAMVFRVAYGVVQNRADAEDVAQTTFLSLVQSQRAIRDAQALRAWLCRVAVNAARQVLRGESRRRRREESWARDHAEANEEQSMPWTSDERIEGVREAMSALPETLRLPLQLHYGEGLKYREIATVLECPEGTVAKRLHTGRQRLERDLAPLTAVGVLPLGDALRMNAPSVPAGLSSRIQQAVDSAVATLPSQAWYASRRGWVSVASTIALVTLAWICTANWSGGTTPSALATATERSDDRSPEVAADAEAGPALQDDDSQPPPPPLPRAVGVDGDSLPPELKELLDKTVSGKSTVEAGVARFAGRIIDDAGQPIEGAKVELRHRVRQTGRTRIDYTDVDGRFEFLGVETHLDDPTPVRPAQSQGVDWQKHKPPFIGQTMSFGGASVTIRASKPGYRSRSEGSFIVSAGLDWDRDIPLPAAKLIAGVVNDPDGVPLAGAVVKVMGGVAVAPGRSKDVYGLVRDAFFDGLHDEDRTATTDHNGRFELPNLGDARYLIEASALGLEPAEQLVRSGNGDDVEFALNRSGALEVVLDHRSEKQPIAGARVGLYREGREVVLATTDVAGRVRFDAAPGQYSLAVFRNAHPLHVEPVTLVAGTVVSRRVQIGDGIELTLRVPVIPRELGTSLRIHLRAANDSEAAKAGIGVRTHSFSLNWRPHVAVEYVSADGVKVFGGLAPGRYLAEVFGSHGKGSASTKVVSQVIDLGPAPRRVEVDLGMSEFEHATVIADVRDANGDPVKKPALYVLGDSHEFGQTGVASDVDGQASITLPVGQHRVTVTSTDFLPITVDLDVRANETRRVTVTLESRLPALAALAESFDDEQHVWIAPGASYRALTTLLAATGSIPIRIDPRLTAIANDSRVPWNYTFPPTKLIRMHLSYLGVNWEVRDGALWLVPR